MYLIFSFHSTGHIAQHTEILIPWRKKWKKGNKKYCIFLLENLGPQVWGEAHQCPSLQEALRSAGSSGEGRCAHCLGLYGKNCVGCPWPCQLRPSVSGHLGGLPVGGLVS